MDRIVIAGTSGSGKTTLARRVAAALDLPRWEMDALFHGPGWTQREEFLDDVRRHVAGERWVTEWQYETARPLLSARADTLVWLDLPVRVTMTGVVRRTVSRRVRQTELWNGNTEPSLVRAVVSREDGIVRWAWDTRHRLRTEVPQALAEHPHLRHVHLRSRAEADRWVASLARG